jgi:hypothetical protein
LQSAGCPVDGLWNPLRLTNLERSPTSGVAPRVLELYGCQWQLELALKRLRGQLKLGHLPKNDPPSACAWMQRKLLLALVFEKLCYDARFFPSEVTPT